MEYADSQGVTECGCEMCPEQYRRSGCALDRLASRVALDLHDGVAQSLTAILLDLSIAADDTTATTPHPDAVRLTQHITDALSQVRILIDDLHPYEESRSSLADRLDSVLRQFEIETGASVSVDISLRDLNSLGRVTEITTFRVIQESLNNIRRHAQATHVSVHLKTDSTHLHATITDDGNGIEADRADRVLDHCAGMGMGMAGMRERIQMLSGTMELISLEGVGTTLKFSIPVRHHHGCH